MIRSGLDGREGAPAPTGASASPRGRSSRALRALGALIVWAGALWALFVLGAIGVGVALRVAEWAVGQ